MFCREFQLTQCVFVIVAFESSLSLSLVVNVVVPWTDIDQEVNSLDSPPTRRSTNEPFSGVYQKWRHDCVQIFDPISIVTFLCNLTCSVVKKTFNLSNLALLTKKRKHGFFKIRKISKLHIQLLINAIKNRY
jgi:hypothetical protein